MLSLSDVFEATVHHPIWLALTRVSLVLQDQAVLELRPVPNATGE
jgi:hypothetical protein